MSNGFSHEVVNKDGVNTVIFKCYGNTNTNFPVTNRFGPKGIKVDAYEFRVMDGNHTGKTTTNISIDVKGSNLSVCIIAETMNYTKDDKPIYRMMVDTLKNSGHSNCISVCNTDIKYAELKGNQKDMLWLNDETSKIREVKLYPGPKVTVQNRNQVKAIVPMKNMEKSWNGNTLTMNDNSLYK